jgi:hypothetical protein
MTANAQVPIQFDILGPLPAVDFGQVDRPTAQTLRIAATALGVLISDDELQSPGVSIFP